MIERAGHGMVMLIGVQSNQVPRALDIARPLRARGIQVAIGGFHMSGVISMINGDDDCAARGAGARHLDLRRRGRGAPRRGAARCLRAQAEAALQLHERHAGARRRADPGARARAREARRRRDDQLRRRSRLPVPVLVLHHHQRAGAQVAAAHRRTTSRRSSAPTGSRGSSATSSRTTTFARNKDWEVDPRPPDPSARGREDGLLVPHPGRHARLQDAELHREVRARRRQEGLHRAGEHQPRQPAGREEEAEQDHRIPPDAARLAEGRHPLLRGLHHRLPGRHRRVDPARHRRADERSCRSTCWRSST